MKKWLLKVLVILVMLGSFSTDTVSAANNNANIITEKDNSKTVSKSSNKSIIIAEKGTSKAVLKQVKKDYKLLPDYIKDYLKKEGWKIVISKESLQDRFNYDFGILALTHYEYKTIYISNCDGDIEHSLIHEAGHVLDYMNNLKYRDSKRFDKIRKKEGKKLRKFHYTSEKCITTTKEYFAESFQQYIVNPKALKKNCPQTYKYMSEVLRNNSKRAKSNK